MDHTSDNWYSTFDIYDPGSSTTVSICTTAAGTFLPITSPESQAMVKIISPTSWNQHVIKILEHAVAQSCDILAPFCFTVVTAPASSFNGLQ